MRVAVGNIFWLFSPKRLTFCYPKVNGSGRKVGISVDIDTHRTMLLLLAGQAIVADFSECFFDLKRWER